MKVPKSSYSCFKDMPPIFDDITPMPPRLNRQQSAASSPRKGSVDSQEKVADDVEKFETAFSGDTTAANEDDSDSDALPDTDDYDSEASPRSPESCKKSKWFKKFLEGLEYLSTEEINDPARQWLCPSCQGVAGAIKWYLGLQTLMKHAKTKGSRRLRLHRELAQLLEEKLHGSLATSAALGGEACGKPKLKYEMRSYEEMVVNGIRQMSEDNLQLPWLQNRVAEQQSHAKDLEESIGMLKEKLDKANKDLEILRLKAKQQHEQDMEEMDFLEQFYKDQIRNILEARKDGDFQNTRQKEVQENAEISNANPSNRNDYIKNTEREKGRVIEAMSRLYKKTSI
ncbi:hypothetical protein GH714_028713 [Hevea brasiliensis]|uniref:Zinc finger-XS domain-containing protein n=1 Tax=Hevea brasiliensis TaxID=3981 RepID=A0A6A6LPZ7_HEVBR|nr:hypothetical protein GH714_028713 [Hevea brasiliensis]